MRSQSEQYKAALIGEYEMLAAYYRTEARLLRDKLSRYKYFPEEIAGANRDIEDAWKNASEFQALADKMKGDTNGFEEIVFETAVSSQLPRKAEVINCTTVL